MFLLFSQWIWKFISSFAFEPSEAHNIMNVIRKKRKALGYWRGFSFLQEKGTHLMASYLIGYKNNNYSQDTVDEILALVCSCVWFWFAFVLVSSYTFWLIFFLSIGNSCKLHMFVFFFFPSKKYIYIFCPGAFSEPFVLNSLLISYQMCQNK